METKTVSDETAIIHDMTGTAEEHGELLKAIEGLIDDLGRALMESRAGIPRGLTTGQIAALRENRARAAHDLEKFANRLIGLTEGARSGRIISYATFFRAQQAARLALGLPPGAADANAMAAEAPPAPPPEPVERAAAPADFDENKGKR